MNDPTAAEMRRFLRRRHGTEADDVDIEAAIYWFAHDWHGGQSSNLYSALSTSDYTPSRLARSVEDESAHTALMYADLEDQYGAKREGSLAKEQGRRIRGEKNPALPKPGTPIVGYVHAPGRIVAESARGKKFTGWVIVRTVEHYRGTYVSGNIEAVVVEFHPSTRTRRYFGAGLSLGNGMLFRGEVVGYDEDEARRQAKVEAEYWLERDAEDERESERDDEDADD